MCYLYVHLCFVAAFLIQVVSVMFFEMVIIVLKKYKSSAGVTVQVSKNLYEL